MDQFCKLRRGLINQSVCTLCKSKTLTDRMDLNINGRSKWRDRKTLDCRGLGALQLFAGTAAGLCFAPKLP